MTWKTGLWFVPLCVVCAVLELWLLWCIGTLYWLGAKYLWRVLVG